MALEPPFQTSRWRWLPVELPRAAHITDDLTLLDILARRGGDRPHVAVQGAVLVAIGHFAVVDDDIVAVAAAGPARHLHITAGGCIDGRAARRGKIGAAVGGCPRGPARQTAS